MPHTSLQGWEKRIEELWIDLRPYIALRGQVTYREIDLRVQRTNKFIAEKIQQAREEVIEEIFPKGLDDPEIDQSSYGWIVLALRKYITPPENK